MSPLEQLDWSAREFARRLEAVASSDWPRPTPCSDWNVRDLVNHVIGGCHRYTMLLHGAGAAEVTATRVLDHIGDNASASFAEASTVMRSAFHEPGALARSVHHPAGDRTATELLQLRIVDFTIHAWDLSQAIGTDDRLDAGLVRAVWHHVSNNGLGVTGAYFAEPPERLGQEVDLQDQLLNLTGRSRARWAETPQITRATDVPDAQPLMGSGMKMPRSRGMPMA